MRTDRHIQMDDVRTPRAGVKRMFSRGFVIVLLKHKHRESESMECE